MSNQKIAIICLLCISFGYIACLFYNSSKNMMKPVPMSIIRDTIIQNIPQEPIIIEKVKAKIIQTLDTLILTQPFIATIDTIIKYDTIRAEYQFPTHLFSLEIRKKPDTIRTEYITITRQIAKEESWWEKPALIVGSAALGYVAGRIIK